MHENPVVALCDTGQNNCLRDGCRQHLRETTSHNEGNLLASLATQSSACCAQPPSDVHVSCCGLTPAPKRRRRQAWGAKLGGACPHPLPASAQSNPATKPPSPTAKKVALFPFIYHEKTAQSPSYQGKGTQLLSSFTAFDNQHRHGDPAGTIHQETKGLPSYFGNVVT